MNNPPIVAPVMRIIGVADKAASIAFYRDILGFEIRDRDGATEAVCGPARIHFGEHDYSPTDWDNPIAPGSAMLFFQTGDIAAIHAAIRARGGRPSAVEKVNWIKFQMFEIRDPDGHALWFGQSYQEPDKPRPHMLEKALPGLPFDDVAAAIKYYCDVLGFHINYQQDDLGVMDRDDVTLLLNARTERTKGISRVYFYIEDADKLYAEFRAKGAKLQGEPVSHPWGLRDFRVLDCEGNELTFGQPFE